MSVSIIQNYQFLDEQGLTHTGCGVIAKNIGIFNLEGHEEYVVLDSPEYGNRAYVGRLEVINEHGTVIMSAESGNSATMAELKIVFDQLDRIYVQRVRAATWIIKVSPNGMRERYLLDGGLLDLEMATSDGYDGSVSRRISGGGMLDFRYDNPTLTNSAGVVNKISRTLYSSDLDNGEIYEMNREYTTTTIERGTFDRKEIKHPVQIECLYGRFYLAETTLDHIEEK